MFRRQTPSTVLLAAFLLLVPLSVWAHQPRFVGTDRATTVVAAEVSKAYYGKLDGVPAEYFINATAPFALYANILVPFGSDAATRPSMEIWRDGQRLAWFDGPTSNWKKFHEEFAGDDYWQGPEYRLDAVAGNYAVIVSNVGNSGKYVLAIGEKEDFPLSETLRALSVIPQLKKDFFGVPKWSFLFSIFGAVEFFLMLAFGFLLGFVYRRLLKFMPGSRPSTRHNIGRGDRLSRLAIAVAAAVYGLFVWSPLAFVVAGFVLYEAFAKWCAFYAAIGRNTCPA